MHPFVHKRPGRERIEPAPESGVRLTAERPMRAGWVGLRGSVEQLFRDEGARVWRDDPITTAKDEHRC